MDYKSRNKMPQIWTRDEFFQHRSPEPYDCLLAGGIYEVDSPDGSATFLSTQYNWCEETGFSKHIAIEAPPSCPTRYSFEIGDISWTDFWTHRGWLLHIQTREGLEYCTVSYIRAKDAPRKFFSFLRCMGPIGPFEIKRLNYERIINTLSQTFDPPMPNAGSLEHTVKKYQRFMTLHGDKFTKKAG